MINRALSGFSILVLTCAALHGQAISTASKTFDLQAGGQYVFTKTDYFGTAKRGAGVYATFDFTRHFGIEFDFRKAVSSYDPAYEKTYEMGGRYHRSYGRFSPYAKALYGRGVFNFVSFGTVVANLAYNEYVLGGGTDYKLTPWLNLRGDYEYQHWMSFPPNGLTPQTLSFGVAYHVPGGLKKGNRFK